MKLQHEVDMVEDPKILVKFGLRVTYFLSMIFHMKKLPQFRSLPSPEKECKDNELQIIQPQGVELNHEWLVDINRVQTFQPLILIKYVNIIRGYINL